jgi:NAD(P)-dependent dehydrogenase (short-subunit alcohol dehydrogenase family)
VGSYSPTTPPPTNTDLTGKTAIVSGVSRGLGVSSARGLAKAGCDLVIPACTFDELQQVARERETFGHQVVPIRPGVSKARDVESTVREAVERLGHIDILANKAGTTAAAMQNT